VLHLRLIVPPDLTDVVVEQLAATPGVVHLVRGSGSATQPAHLVGAGAVHPRTPVAPFAGA